MNVTLYQLIPKTRSVESQKPSPTTNFKFTEPWNKQHDVLKTKKKIYCEMLQQLKLN
jgi:hypothetical protein